MSTDNKPYKPYVHNLADLTFRPAGCNGAMRSYTAKPAGQFRRLLFQKILESAWCCRPFSMCLPHALAR